MIDELERIQERDLEIVERLFSEDGPCPAQVRRLVLSLVNDSRRHGADWRKRMAEIERQLADGGMATTGPRDNAVVAVIRLRRQLADVASALEAMTHPTDPQHESLRYLAKVARLVLEETKST